MSMPTITELGAGFNTDKGWFHQYFEIYDTLLARHRASARRVLEIGVLDGGSLQLWAEAFPAAEVHGIDPAPRSVPEHDRITVRVADAYTPDTIAAFGVGGFNVIIDDGPHTLESMLFVAEHYTELLAPGGTLVIEDIADPSWVPQIAERLPADMRRHAFAVDRRHAPRPDRGGWVDVASIVFVVDVAS